MPVAFKTNHALLAWSHAKARQAAVPYMASYQNQGKSSRLKKKQILFYDSIHCHVLSSNVM
jgi:hypothetical protein